MSNVGLVMIVKNEAHVIERCLESVRPILDYVIIADTGSTDDTRERIRGFLARHGLDGQVVEHEWKNFAHNRSRALAALREVSHVDYGFTIDADETLELESSFDRQQFKGTLYAGLYDVEVWNGGIRYTRPALFSNRLPFRYEAVLHEYLVAPPDITRGRASGFHVMVSHDGARSQNPDKFADDAALLERELKSETDPMLVSRYTFYLAQSYRDCGQNEKALAAYLKRAGQGGWIEEVYVSLLNAGRVAERLERPVDEVIAIYLRAYDALPTRAEALCGAAAACRKHKRYNLGYMLARQGLTIARPPSGLFVEPAVYDYRLLDELQVNAYWAGHFQESFDAGARLIHEGMFPESDRARIVANGDYALQKLMELKG